MEIRQKVRKILLPKLAVFLFIALVISVPSFAQNPSPLQECAGSLSASDLDKWIDALIAQMTPEERIAQLQDRAPAIPRLNVPAYNWWNEGLHGIARNGFATVFPQAIGLAATFDPDLVASTGDVVSTEARAKFNSHQDTDSARYAGLTIWSPNINIFRDPRWGRGQETYGEDPYLTGLLGGEFVRGIQGMARKPEQESESFYLKANATPKHFAVHSGPESQRDGFNARVSQHDLEDTYLAAFQTLISGAHPAAMMCSYNAINGTPACANDRLLADHVRKDWGFSGYIVSDCDAVDEITEYLHFTSDHAHGAAAALKAGVDLDCGATYTHLNESLAQHLITEQDINRALHRLLLARLRLGMLQPDKCSPYSVIGPAQVDTHEDRTLALRAAAESMVLLKNEGHLLPLNLSGKRVAVIGPTADLLEEIEANYHGTVQRPMTLLDGLQEALPLTAPIFYAQGSKLAEGLTLPIPRTALRTKDGMNAARGLTGEYFDNGTLSGTPVIVRVDQRVDFDLDRVMPAPELRGPYSIRWSGELLPPAAGTYRLRVGIDRCFDCKGHDGYRLWVDGKKLLDDDGSSKKNPDAVSLEWKTAEPHTMRLELLHTGEDEGIHLEWEAPAEAQLKEALAAAEHADVILAMVGLSPSLEGEALGVHVPDFFGGDRLTLALPEPQRRLLAALSALHKPLVVVLSSGSAVAPGEEARPAGAIMETWYPGEEGGHALAKLLSGAINPSGRLPVTVYRSVSDLPAFNDYSMAHRTYRYFDGPVEYPFGFGLSYTTFNYAEPRVSSSTLAAGQSLEVNVMVRNSGHRDGDEVAQLYLIPPAVAGSPRLSLQGVRRIHLKAGESKQIEFTLAPKQLSAVDSEGMRNFQSGKYRVFVGGSQPSDLNQVGTIFELVKK